MVLPSPPIGPWLASPFMASRIRMERNHALLRVMPKVRLSWVELMPFLLLQIRWIAASQSRMAIWLSSKMVPTLTVKGLRQA